MTQSAIRQLAGRIRDYLDSNFAEVLQVRDLVSRSLAAAGERPTTEDLARCSSELIERLGKGDGRYRGLGAILAPGVLADAPLWIEWWQVQGGAATRTQFSFDPESIDYYDYTRADWFLIPHQPDARSVVGPYVDFGGVNDYILTMTTPVHLAGSFAGVAGADLRVDELERRLYHAARGLRTPLAVVNDSGRVVGSTSASMLAGSILRRPATGDRVEVPGWPWQVVAVG